MAKETIARVYVGPWDQSFRLHTLAMAMETARMALAPSLPLFSVPSSAIILSSMAFWSTGLSP